MSDTEETVYVILRTTAPEGDFGETVGVNARRAQQLIGAGRAVAAAGASERAESEGAPLGSDASDAVANSGSGDDDVVPGGGALDDLSYDELMGLARDLDIDGRSSMTKPELLAAVQEAS